MVQRTWSLRNVPLSTVFKTQLWDFVWTCDSSKGLQHFLAAIFEVKRKLL